MSPRPFAEPVVTLVIAALLAPAALLGVADAATAKTVKLKGQQFTPRRVSIHRGDRITFRWAGGSHDLIGPHVHVGARSHGTRTVAFRKKGTFTFVCTLHARMSVKVKVT